MNIDKFGHHVHKRLRRSEIFDNDNVLSKSENGEFNLRLVRLRGIKSPSSADDAANKEYVDRLISQSQKADLLDPEKLLIKSEDGDFDLHSSRLKGVKHPSAADDVVNKQYVDSLFDDYSSNHKLTVALNDFRTGIASYITKQLEKYYTKSQIDSIVTSIKK